MNAFYEHHKDSIRFGYRCFDRLLLNGLIQPFQQPKRVIGFFNFYRQHYPHMVKILDLFDALRLADRDDLPLPHAVHESKKDVNGIFATLHPDVTRGSASCRAESAKPL